MHGLVAVYNAITLPQPTRTAEEVRPPPAACGATPATCRFRSDRPLASRAGSPARCASSPSSRSQRNVRACVQQASTDVARRPEAGTERSRCGRSTARRCRRGRPGTGSRRGPPVRVRAPARRARPGLRSAPGTGPVRPRRVQCLVRCEALGELAEPELAHAPEVLDENRFLAARDGIDAQLIDPHRDRSVPASGRLARGVVFDVCWTHARTLRCERELGLLAHLAGDPGAARQRAIASEPAGVCAGCSTRCRRSSHLLGHPSWLWQREFVCLTGSRPPILCIRMSNASVWNWWSNRPLWWAHLHIRGPAWLWAGQGLCAPGVPSSRRTMLYRDVPVRAGSASVR